LTNIIVVTTIKPKGFYVTATINTQQTYDKTHNG